MTSRKSSVTHLQDGPVQRNTNEKVKHKGEMNRSKHLTFPIAFPHWSPQDQPYLVHVTLPHGIVYYRLAPPASGDTMQLFFHSGMFSRIHWRTAGSAYRLSTAMSKNPYGEIRKSEYTASLISLILSKNIATTLDFTALTRNETNVATTSRFNSI